jgi:hypothetical protein
MTVQFTGRHRRLYVTANFTGVSMGRYLALIATSGLVLTVVLFDARVSVARPEYGRRTKKECSYCHPPNSWDINEAGKYFRDHHNSLEGFKPSAGGGK